MLYLDTSLLIAALTREARTPEIQTWLSAQDPATLAISDWVITEFSAALSIKIRKQHLSVAHRAKVLSAFNSLVKQTLTLIPLSSMDFLTAARLADQYSTGLRAGDALHLALASSQGACIYSLDKTLVTAAIQLGIRAKLL
ncbi:MAG: type II toxin-antitoxin system VapC family toxin [Gammaproteobacteria bacterium SHHR-1]|uniref:type II toxin-antitoxin system VapC family toxin n=1 Tax=Magnetovirga frankeli TaxID=947516 RepID=UPI0012938EFF|nr:type II toxin-antitoxin system VapC family toxin [gamma proteobacterium SS-5]